MRHVKFLLLTGQLKNRWWVSLNVVPLPTVITVNTSLPSRESIIRRDERYATPRYSARRRIAAIMILHADLRACEGWTTTGWSVNGVRKDLKR